MILHSDNQQIIGKEGAYQIQQERVEGLFDIIIIMCNRKLLLNCWFEFMTLEMIEKHRALYFTTHKKKSKMQEKKAPRNFAH